MDSLTLEAANLSILGSNPHRKLGPPIQEIGAIPSPVCQSTLLDNGSRLIEVNMGSQELVRLEIIHFASRSQEDKQGVSRATARLLREGTVDIDTKAISAFVDYHGASLSTGANLDYSFVRLFTLTKYFEKLLPTVEQVRYQPTFPQEELDRYIKNNIQKLALDESKAEQRSYKAITEAIFGENHIYGYNSNKEIYESLTREDLKDHFANYFGSSNSLIVLSGKVTPAIRAATIAAFGSIKQEVLLNPYAPTEVRQEYRKINLSAENKSQTGIKIGTKLWGREHRDFSKVFVLNTVLGGYFGSRLMSTIREQKGYTYSIYSGMDMFVNDGYFFIATEVGNENVTDTIESIYSEMDKLQQDLVGDKELTMIKNYLQGSFLGMVDGPFKMANMVKLLAINNLNKSFFSDLSNYVKDIDAEEIRAAAQQYFRKETMTEVIVG